MGAPKIRLSKDREERWLRREMRRGATGLTVSIAFDNEGFVIAVGRNHDVVGAEVDRLGKRDHVADVRDFPLVTV